MATASNLGAIDDPAEIAYWNHRRVVRRRQFWAIVASAALVAGYFGWKAGSHAVAWAGLELNHFKVIWGVDRVTWKQGGTTTVKYAEPYYIFQQKPSSLTLKCLTWLHHVEELDLAQASGLQDSDLEFLSELNALRVLDLDRTRSNMWRANEQGQLTDATLARIGHLKQLGDLHLGGQRITDAGLANLEGLDRLQSLDLRKTAITDVGLEHLKAIPGLKSVDLTGTNVTSEGVGAFEASRPGVRVVADPPLPSPPAAPNPRAKR